MEEISKKKCLLVKPKALYGAFLKVLRGTVLKEWEGFFKEMLNQEGSNGELEIPFYVEEKVDLVEEVGNWAFVLEETSMNAELLG